MPSILVIDDNDELRDMLGHALEQAGYQTWKASDGKEGLRLLQRHPIDLLITDIVMPNQDGMETIQLARKLRPDLRIIAISGEAPRHAPLYLDMAGKLGADRTLLKPFSHAAILEAVRELMT